MDKTVVSAAFDKVNTALRDAGFVSREEAAMARKKRIMKAAAIITTTGIAAFGASYVYYSNKNKPTIED